MAGCKTYQPVAWAPIDGDDQSLWRSHAVQSLDNETDVMRLFSFQVRSRPQRIGIHCNRESAMRRHCFDPPVAFARSPTQILGWFLSRNRPGREYQWWLCLNKPVLPGEDFGSKTRPKPDVNFKKRPASHFAGRKKCTFTNGRVWKT